jgi:hypothetical protein
MNRIPMASTRIVGWIIQLTIGNIEDGELEAATALRARVVNQAPIQC